MSLNGLAKNTGGAGRVLNPQCLGILRGRALVLSALGVAACGVEMTELAVKIPGLQLSKAFPFLKSGFKCDGAEPGCCEMIISSSNA